MLGRLPARLTGSIGSVSELSAALTRVWFGFGRCLLTSAGSPSRKLLARAQPLTLAHAAGPVSAAAR